MHCPVIVQSNCFLNSIFHFARFVEVMEDNPHWWLVANEEGEKGFVPAKYMEVCIM